VVDAKTRINVTVGIVVEMGTAIPITFRKLSV
jgi:hypothetical protein